MGNFESKRSEMIKKKNDFIIKSMEINDSIEVLDKRKSDVEEGISRIPDDLPEELQEQVDAAIENTRNTLKEESSDLEKKASEVAKEADEAMDFADELSSDLQQKSQKMAALSGIPLIGSFAETKGEQLADQAEQMMDLRQETQQYQDKLLNQRNKLFQK